MSSFGLSAPSFEGYLELHSWMKDGRGHVPGKKAPKWAAELFGRHTARLDCFHADPVHQYITDKDGKLVVPDRLGELIVLLGVVMFRRNDDVKPGFRNFWDSLSEHYLTGKSTGAFPRAACEDIFFTLAFQGASSLPSVPILGLHVSLHGLIFAHSSIFSAMTA